MEETSIASGNVYFCNYGTYISNYNIPSYTGFCSMSNFSFYRPLVLDEHVLSYMHVTITTISYTKILRLIILDLQSTIQIHQSKLNNEM